MNRIEELFRQTNEYYLDALDRKYPDFDQVMDKKLPVVIYGAGRMGEKFLYNLQKLGIAAQAFADGNAARWGQQLAGVDIVDPTTIKARYGSAAVLIASLLYESEIEAKLYALGTDHIYPLRYLNLKHPDIFISPEYEGESAALFDEANRRGILALNELWNDDESRRIFQNIIEFRLTFNKKLIHDSSSKNIQYFENGVIQTGEQEIFADCGAYSGDTLQEFRKQTKNRFKKYYAFEPDEENMKKLRQIIEETDNGRIIPVTAGVYITSGKISFLAEGALDSRISLSQGTDSIQVFSLDDFFKHKEAPTFIKMDIEGAEEEALRGAEGLLRADAPKLAISVYHRAADLWRLPLLIKGLQKHYRLYLRHYSSEIVDTVCYAV